MKHNTMFTPLEVKFEAGDGDMSFSGYGAKFGNVDAYGDVIAPGAFKNSLKSIQSDNNHPPMLWQHNQDQPIGVWTEMREDEKGLWVEGKLADTDKGREAYSLLKMQPHPAIRGMSIGYSAIRAKRREKPTDPRRTLEEIKLWEVSLVTFPANVSAQVENVKSIADLSADEIRELEATLREKGLSRSNAATAISGLKEWCQRDAGEPETVLRDEGAAAEMAEMIRRQTDMYHKDNLKWHLMKSRP